MKYLNRLLVILCSCCAVQIGRGTELPETRSPEPKGATVKIFDYAFTPYPNLGINNYYEYQAEGFHSQLTVIRMESTDEGRIFIEERLSQFKSVFEARRVDYVGQYSRSIECSTEFKPKYFERDIPGGRFSYFEGYAGSNKVAGVCSADLVRYRHVYGLALCQKNNYLLEIEYFMEKSKDIKDDFGARITCEDPVARDGH